MNTLGSGFSHAVIISTLMLCCAADTWCQTPPLPDEGCRIRYRYDEAGNRTRREWQCWVAGEDPDGPGAQDHHDKRVSQFEGNGIVVMPNPASETVSIRLEQPLDGALVEIMDMHGQVLRSARLASAPAPFPVTDLAEGSYAIRISVPGEMLVTSFVVLR